MNQAELNLVVEETIASINKLLRVKGGEYANSEDRLANFKRGASLVGLHPLQVLFIYLSKHYDGVASYVRKSTAGEQLTLSEPIEGRLDDIIVYCTLAKAIIKEARADEERQSGRDPIQHAGGLCGKPCVDVLGPPFVGTGAVTGTVVGNNADVHCVEHRARILPEASIQPITFQREVRLTTKQTGRKCGGCFYEDLLAISWPCCNCFDANRWC